MGDARSRAAMWCAEAQVFIASYETVRADLGPGARGNRQWGVVVIDEAQRIKNSDAEISRAVKQLARERSWALTGTPLENRVDDVISVLDFVAPGRFAPGMFVSGLRRLLGDVQLRRRRVEVLNDLPPKLSTDVLLDLEPRQRATYERAEREGIVRLAALGIDLRISHVLELILRLKQICNFCPTTGTSSKLVDLLERLAKVAANGEQSGFFTGRCRAVRCQTTCSRIG